MDITAVFGTVILGSSPGGGTKMFAEQRFYWPPQKANCLAFVRTRSAERYLASKPNRERRAAKRFFDEKTLFVAESWLHRTDNCRRVPTFLYLRRFNDLWRFLCNGAQ